MGNSQKRPAWDAASESSISDDDTNGKISLIGICSYSSRVEGDLSFCKGDLLFLIHESSSCWWYVEDMYGQKGYIPKDFVARRHTVESKDWYAGKVTRVQAERIVLATGCTKGTFLVREREADSQEWALTIRDTDSSGMPIVKHYRIKRADDGNAFITSGKTFSDVQKLVEYYSKKPHGLCCKLKAPAPRVPPTVSMPSHAVEKIFELPREHLVLEKQLGSGSFGIVWYAKWLLGNNDSFEVAVKEMREGAMTTEQFLKEAEIMKTFDHRNLVKLYAVCTKEMPLYIVTEYMPNGSLLNYLKQERQSLDANTLVDMSAQVALGMQYLEEHKVVHRDLAARNVLVKVEYADAITVKVADFGLARQIHGDGETYADVYGKQVKFPVKWTAPEAATSGQFSSKSDVWSYGILLFEIFSFGEPPYADIESNKEVIERLKEGYRLPRPLNCPEKIYNNAMLECWKKNPDQRPSFEKLHQFFALDCNYEHL